MKLFVSSWSKTYSYLKNNDSDYKKAKGTKDVL